jgi:hypothetical protein
LLLGSWQFLAAPGERNGIVGAVGTAIFIVFAWASLDRMDRMGLDHDRWRSVHRRTWVVAMGGGGLAGVAVFWIGSVFGEGVHLSDTPKLIVLQVALGPVLEGNRPSWLSLRPAPLGARKCASESARTVSSWSP